MLAFCAAALVYAPSRGLLARAAAGLVRAAWREHAEFVRRGEVAAYARRYGISREMADAIERVARAEEVEPDLAFRLVRIESEFDPRAVSPAGAIGLTQLMPATARDLAPGIAPNDLFVPETNLRLGFRYLRLLLRTYGGDRAEALHAYNRGIGTVARIRARGGDPANGYAARVLGREGGAPVPPRVDGATLPLPPSPPASARR